MSVPDTLLCGWRVRSDIRLPELPAWDGDDRTPDLSFAIGPVPPMLDAPVLHTPVVQVDAAGRIRLAIAGVCDYLIEDGARITIAPIMRRDAPDVRLFLLGAGLGIICHQRGILPIHAAAIDIDGRAVMFAGASGSGKSTLAAAFLRRGYRVLSDDLAPLDPAACPPVILPSLRRIKLWHDSASRAGWPVDEIERCRETINKYNRPLEADHVARPLRPAALIHLDRGRDDTIGWQRLRGAAAVMAIRPQVYRWRSLVGLRGRDGAMRSVSLAAPAIPRHFRLTRPMCYRALDETIDAVLEKLAEAPVPGGA